MATSDIYIDSSFLSVNTDGVEDVQHELSVDSPDNIGGRNVQVVLDYLHPTSSSKDLNVLYETSATVSGTPLMFLVEYFREDSFSWSDLAVMAELTLSPATLSGSKYVDIDYFNRHEYSAGDQFVRIYYVVGDSTTKATIPVAVGLITASGVPTFVDIKQKYMNFSGNYDAGNNPIASISGVNDIQTVYSTYSITNSGVIDSVVDITFSGWVPWNAVFDVYSVWENVRDGQTYYFPFDVTTRSGGLTGALSDVLSAAENEPYFVFETKSATQLIKSTIFDLYVVPGFNRELEFDVMCGTNVSGSLVFDVQLLSMYFDNFSLDVGEYMPASGTICVDVHDEVYNVVTSGTYFMVDGVPVSGTLTPISDGYRLCYNPADDFESLLGPTKFTARAENDNGDVITRDFYVTFGYVVEYDNYENGIDFGFGNQIAVRVEASNLMNCPIDDAEGFWFVSRDYFASDLTASIYAVPNMSGDADLKASIYPRSTAYFYDKLFRMELTVKDYAGNTMEPFILVFQVENLDKK